MNPKKSVSSLYDLVGSYVVVVTICNEKVVFGKLVCRDCAKDLYAVERSNPRAADFLLVPTDVYRMELGRLVLHGSHAARFDV